MCKDYEEARTFYLKLTLSGGYGQKESTNHSCHEEAPIERNDNKLVEAVEGLIFRDYKLLCLEASIGRGPRVSKCNFESYRQVKPSVTMLQDNIHQVKQRYAVRNASMYINIRSNIMSESWKESLEYLLSLELVSKQTTTFFIHQCLGEFMKKWCHPQGEVPRHMKSWETLIPSIVKKHYEVVVVHGLGIYVARTYLVDMVQGIDDHSANTTRS